MLPSNQKNLFWILSYGHTRASHMAYRLQWEPGKTGFWLSRPESALCRCPRYQWWTDPSPSRWCQWTCHTWFCVPRRTQGRWESHLPKRENAFPKLPLWDLTVTQLFYPKEVGCPKTRKWNFTHWTWWSKFASLGEAKVKQGTFGDDALGLHGERPMLESSRNSAHSLGTCTCHEITQQWGAERGALGPVWPQNRKQ